MKNVCEMKKKNILHRVLDSTGALRPENGIKVECMFLN